MLTRLERSAEKLSKTELDRECSGIVRYIDTIYTVSMLKGLKNSSLYRKFVKPREFIKKLLVRIQRTRHLNRYTGKFVISGVRYTGTQLY